uniref:Uncharacterized protein n=1 Tax=Macrostomum lignano TaxID=282301 RepID=A0A1I8I9X5_9PLAT
MDTISSWLTCCPVLHIGGGGIGGSSAKADQEDFVPLKNAESKPPGRSKSAAAAAGSTVDENGRMTDGGRGCVGNYGATSTADQREPQT